jgi:myo-inositol-1(or 4)-monophosphatase
MSELLDSVSTEVRSIGDLILPYFANVAPDLKADGSWLTKADKLSHHRLLEALPKLYDLPVLSEETDKLQQQQIITDSHEGYWCVDPLDGTSNFTQGINYWCISVGLVVSGEVKLAVVYDPHRSELFSTESAQPTKLNGKTLVTSPNNDLAEATVMMDLKRIPTDLVTRLIADHPYRSHRCFGASALDFCWLAANRCQLYLHGQQQLWDCVAGNKILQNAGGTSATFTGDNIFQNDLAPKSVIAASNPQLMQHWQNYFATIYST